MQRFALEAKAAARDFSTGFDMLFLPFSLGELSHAFCSVSSAKCLFLLHQNVLRNHVQQEVKIKPIFFWICFLISASFQSQRRINILIVNQIMGINPLWNSQIHIDYISKVVQYVQLFWWMILKWLWLMKMQMWSRPKHPLWDSSRLYCCCSREASFKVHRDSSSQVQSSANAFVKPKL